MSVISRELVERHVSLLPFVPEEWEVGTRNGYKIDFRMCQIRNLVYDFVWDDESVPPPEKPTIIHTPLKVLVLDLSLNELTTVTHENLAMMPQLRVLDMSLNRISRYIGVEVCKRLYHLNLSHNFITQLEGLQQCRLLAELNLSMNQLQDISSMPPLSNLSELRINNNNISTLDGIQGLSHLKQLHCQRNEIRDLLPLSSTLRLISLNASDNLIHSLHTTVDVLKNLKRLQSVALFGNPIDQEYNYHEQLMKATSIKGLDNVNIKPAPRAYDHSDSKHYTIKDAARQAFMDKLQDRRLKMQQNVDFLQKRILTVQEEYREYEDQVMRDMDSCMLHLDSLGPDQLSQYDVSRLRDGLDHPAPRPWERQEEVDNSDHGIEVPFIPLPSQSPSKELLSSSPSKPRHRKGDYAGISDPDEVLRHAYNELAAEFPQGQTPEPQPYTPAW